MHRAVFGLLSDGSTSVNIPCVPTSRVHGLSYHRFSLTLMFAICASASIPATAVDELESARLAFEEERYEQAIPALQALAESGRSEAQYLLGIAYRDGKGRVQDVEIANEWFERAAVVGHADAQFELGSAYLHGRGVDPSRDEATRWLLKAAASNHSDAAVAVAPLLMAAGDPDRARALLEATAESGDGKSAVLLGSFFESGIGCEQDLDRASAWYRRGGELGEPEGIYRWALLNAPDDASRLAVMRTSAEAGYTPAQYDLGTQLISEGTESSAEGVSWLQSAAEAGLPRAQYDLAIVYRDGIGTERDDGGFRSWIVRAAKSGFPRAEYELAVALTDGLHGFSVDFERAYSLYATAAAAGAVEAEYGLGYLLSHGLGVEQDFALAAGHFRTAAEAGHTPSKLALGNLYANGQGVIESRQLATKWYCDAARDGQPDAIGFLGGDDHVEEACRGFYAEGGSGSQATEAGQKTGETSRTRD